MLLRLENPVAANLVISKCALPAGAGLRLQLSAHAMAQVALTDIHPAWVDNALAGLRKGSLLTCTLLSEIASDKPGKHLESIRTRRISTSGVPSMQLCT